MPEAWRLNWASKRTWDDCLVVLKSLHKSISDGLCRELMAWEPVIISLLRQTSQYADTSEDYNNSLEAKWNSLIIRCTYKWGEILVGQTVVAESTDDVSELGDEED